MTKDDAQAPQRDENGRWLPGQSGNPSGPPKGHVKLSARLKHQLAQPASFDPEAKALAESLGFDPDEMTIGDLLVRQWIRQALDGNHPPAAAIFDRVDGKVVEQIAMEGGPQALQFVLAEAVKPKEGEE